LWQNITAWLEKLFVKIHHVVAHIPKIWATEELQNNEQVGRTAKTEGTQVDLG